MASADLQAGSAPGEFSAEGCPVVQDDGYFTLVIPGEKSNPFNPLLQAPHKTALPLGAVEFAEVL